MQIETKLRIHREIFEHAKRFQNLLTTEIHNSRMCKGDDFDEDFLKKTDETFALYLLALSELKNEGQ